MKVNSNRDISFKSIYNNKLLKRSFEFAADNGALFKASAAVAFATARPIAIMNTPNTDKDNRKIASAKSIISSLIGFFLILIASVPLLKSIKNIDKNPKKYLKSETVDFFKDSLKNLEDSKKYIFGTQLFKLGLDTALAIPKSMIVAWSLPYITEKFNLKNNNDESNGTITTNVALSRQLKPLSQDDGISRPLTKTRKESDKINNDVSFKSNLTENLSKGIGKIFDKKHFQNFVNKYKDTNFPMHIIALTDTLATGAFIHQTKNNNKIKEDLKTPLMFNSAISTGLSILGGYGIDKVLDKPTEKFIEKFKRANNGQKNMEKQVQGIRIIKPILILGTIYYIVIPFISTFFAERVEKLK